MALESATYIDGLVTTNPAASDAISTADDHLRLIKSTIKATFPNITGAVTKTDAEINGLASQADLAVVADDVLTVANAFDAAAPYLVPSGVIVMWSGSIASIPSGWFLCDGENSTPDLRDRFVIGARQDESDVAKTNVTGSLTQTGGSKDAIAVEHTHEFSGTTAGGGSHTHTFRTGTNGAGGTAGTVPTGFNTSYSTVTVSSVGNHTHAFSGTTASTGSSGTNANLPPYFALAYIMKA